jgi:hypothetical protein
VALPKPSVKSPIEILVDGIKARQALVAKNPEEFPKNNRTGLVSAQSDAREELVGAERQYASYVKEAAVAGIVVSSDPAKVQEFLTAAQEISAQPLVVVNCAEMYERLAAVGEPGLGATRQFGSGQLGIIIEEYAAIGREMNFASISSPKWSYDVLVPTKEAFAAAIRDAVRAGVDGDQTNRAYIRLQAYKKALEFGYSSTIVPVLVVGATAEEMPFLQNDLFNAAVVIDLDPKEKVTSTVVKTFFKSMVKTAKQFDATQS